MLTNLLNEFFNFNDYDVFYPSKRIIIKNPVLNTGTVKWNEEKNNWYFTISEPNAEIRVNDEGVDVSYEYNEKGEYGSLKGTQTFFMSYPINSRPETIKARKVGDNIVVTVDKKGLTIK